MQDRSASTVRQEPPEAILSLASAQARAAGQHAIWLYDGHCGFCSWSVRFLLARERAPSTVFVAIQSDAGRDLARTHDVDPDDPSTFLFVEEGRAFAKSDGVAAMARHLRWPWRALCWLRFLPRAWRDRAYDILARNRYRIFGKYEACFVPDAEMRARVLE